MEVPMGGRNLGAASTGLKDGEASDDDIKVISDNGSSNGSKAFAGQNFPGRLGGAGMSITPLGGQGSRWVGWPGWLGHHYLG
jgi:hypothetical protein